MIQSVKRQHSGLYKCEVVNAKGETTSNEIKMRVKCKYRTRVKFLLQVGVKTKERYKTRK